MKKPKHQKRRGVPVKGLKTPAWHRRKAMQRAIAREQPDRRGERT